MYLGIQGLNFKRSWVVLHETEDLFIERIINDKEENSNQYELLNYMLHKLCMIQLGWKLIYEVSDINHLVSKKSGLNVIKIIAN